MSAGLKMLIVDDESYVRDGIEKNLPWKQLGIEKVLKAETGREGLMLAEKYQPDVIISDVRMPQMDGLEMARAMAERFPKTKLIFISAYSEIEYYRSAMKLHAVAFVEKPIILEELSEEVQRAVDQIRAERRMSEVSASDDNEIAFLSLLHGTNAVPNTLKRWIAAKPNAVFSVFVVGRAENSENRAYETVRSALEGALQPDVTNILCGMAGRSFAAVIISAPLNAMKTSAIAQVLMRCGEKAFVTYARADAADQVCQAYGAAAARQEFGFFFSNAHFYDADGTSIMESPPAVFGSEFVDAFAACIREGDFNRAMTCVRAEMDKLILPRMCAPEYARMAVSHLLNIAEDCFAHIGVPCDEVRIENGRFETFDELVQFAEECLKRMFASAGEQSAGGRLIYTIKREIEMRYADSTFSIAALAKQLHFSENYLGSLFKRHTSMTIGSYLNQVRMERAKQLLRDPAQRVNEVSALIGIENTDYFTRRFKQYTGKTPSEFRR